MNHITQLEIALAMPHANSSQTSELCFSLEMEMC